MAAFQVSINGKPYCETEDITVVTMVAEQIRRGQNTRVSLHAAGEGPQQWLAANLGVGDEIVVRIVDAIDEDDAAPLSCSFCARDLHEVSSLVQGHSATTAICDSCIVGLGEAVRNGSSLPLGASIHDEPHLVCGFCANQPGSVPGVIVRNGAAICAECLRACSDILADRPRRSVE